MRSAQISTAPSRLRLRRISLGLRLRDVEFSTDIPESSLSRLERGEQEPTHWQLRRLARVLGITSQQVLAELALRGLDETGKEATAGDEAA